MNIMNFMIKATFIVLCLVVSTALYAQKNHEETIYLKNGSVVTGTIIEETNDHLKIETSDGNLYTIGFYDVDKIIRNNERRRGAVFSTRQTQRNVSTSGRRTLNSSNNAGNNVYDDNINYDYSTRHSLYKGFMELGYSWGMNNDGNDDNSYKKVAYIVSFISKNNKGASLAFSRFEFSTSHGIVFNNHYNYVPMAFLGFGFGGQIYSHEDGQIYLFPLFLHTRIHFTDSRVAPFADLKWGYSLGFINNDDVVRILDDTDASVSISGLYITPSLGVRFATGSRSGISLSLGYTNQKISKAFLYSKSYNYNITQNWNINLPAVSFKLGFDF